MLSLHYHTIYIQITYTTYSKLIDTSHLRYTSHPRVALIYASIAYYCQAAKLPGYQTSKLPSFQGTRLPGRQTTKLPSYLLLRTRTNVLGD